VAVVANGCANVLPARGVSCLSGGVHWRETVVKQPSRSVSGVGSPGAHPQHGQDSEVVVVRWPGDSGQGPDLAAAGVPRLWLVESGPPPDSDDLLEDWVRLPAPESDVAVRVAALRRRAGHLGPPVPSIDGDGVVRFGGSWVALPPVEARIMGALVERFAAVVLRGDLAVAGWPEGAPGRNALDVHVLRLRRRISPVGLAIRTVRSRGYLLEAAGDRALGNPGPEGT
jgi:hypothetical protein